jgi:hypothetical protein
VRFIADYFQQSARTKMPPRASSPQAEQFLEIQAFSGALFHWDGGHETIPAGDETVFHAGRRTAETVTG